MITIIEASFISTLVDIVDGVNPNHKLQGEQNL
jgi:hypothetical protein